MTLIASDKKRVVIGLGQTGLSCARFLKCQGLGFSVADNRQSPPGLADFRREFGDLDVQLGAFRVGQFDDADELYVSPGISLREPAIASAVAAGVRISGDLDLFAEQVSVPVAAITGSNGKSTVTTLLGEMAADAGKRVAVCGNIGTPMLDLVAGDYELYVLELSSFQLERSNALRAEVATVLNISEDHLDHHGSLLAYHQAKHRIYNGCRNAVVNRDDTLTQPLLPASVPVWSFGLSKPDLNQFGLLSEDGCDYLACGDSKLMRADELQIRGRHNISNALAALAMGQALGLPMQSMLNTLRRFSGLEHRCQYIAQVDGVDFYDDSKGTNVGAAVASLQGVGRSQRVVLIAGGQAKGADLSPVVDALVNVGRAAVFIGESSDILTHELDERLPSCVASSMDEAVTAAFGFAAPGDAVLLSPACASFDMFENYQHRGRCFQDAVHAVAAGGRA